MKRIHFIGPAIVPSLSFCCVALFNCHSLIEQSEIRLWHVFVRYNYMRQRPSNAIALFADSIAEYKSATQQQMPHVLQWGT